MRLVLDTNIVPDWLAFDDSSVRSQGLAVGKDTLHHYLAHLEDAFLLRTVAMHSASERQRMVNPRKAYPVDPGLIALYERSGREHKGRALETVVLLELERRGYEVSYLRTMLIRLSPKDTIGGVFGQSKPTTSSGFGRKPDKHASH